MFPLHTTVYARHVPVVTWIIVAVNALVFLVEVELPQNSLESVTYLFGVVPARFTHPEWAAQVGFPLHDYWPFLTSMFLHGRLLHIVGNMWTLAVFGRNVEDRMGPVRYLVFYLLCGIISGIVHTLVNSTSTMPAIGASGAIGRHADRARCRRNRPQPPRGPRTSRSAGGRVPGVVAAEGCQGQAHQGGR